MYERLASASVIDPSTVSRVSLKRTGVLVGPEKPFYRLMMEFSSDSIIPFGGGIDTLTHAVLERGIFVKSGDGFSPRPTPDPDASFAPFLDAYRSIASPTARLTPEEFLRSRPGRLRRVYDLAVDRNRTDWFDLHKESITQGFVKVEKTQWPCGNALFPEEGTSKFPVPRLINPRTPRFNSMLGPYTIACEHNVYDNIGHMFGKPCIAKGLNFTQRAALLREMWDEFVDPVFVGQDASRFDQHTGELALSLDHAVIQTHFPGDTTLAWLLRQQKKNVMYGRCLDGEIRADLQAMRMSGDMNTALGNCVISSALLWQWLKKCNVRAYAIVDGDDAGCIMERKDFQRYMEGAREYFLSFGYNMVIEDPVDVFERIQFCQTQPVWVGDGWRMVRNPKRALNNDYSGYQQMKDPRYVSGLLYAIGSAGLSLASGVPVLQEFYKMGMRLGKHAPRSSKMIELQLSGLQYAANKEGKRKEAPVTDDTRASFALAFGIPPHVQVALEQHLASVQVDLRVQQAPGTKYQSEFSQSAIPIPQGTQC